MERTYIIPLRKEFLKAQRYKRAKKAITGVKIFLKRHMKSDDLHLGKYLNEEIWSRGIKNPPTKVKVLVKKMDDGKVVAELVGKPFPVLEKKKSEKKEKGKIEETVEKLTGKKSKKEAKSEIKDAEVVKEEKKEVKTEVKKE